MFWLEADINIYRLTGYEKKEMHHVVTLLVAKQRYFLDINGLPEQNHL